MPKGRVIIGTMKLATDAERLDSLPHLTGDAGDCRLFRGRLARFVGLGRENAVQGGNLPPASGRTTQNPSYSVAQRFTTNSE